MRLLSVRPDHAGGSAAEDDPESERRRHRSRDGGEHLPLRHLSAHSRRHQDCGEGACVMVVENISGNPAKAGLDVKSAFRQRGDVDRRQFLGGLFSTGAFVIASRLVPSELLAQSPAAAILNTKADTAALHPSVYLGIEPDGTVFLVTHRSEMGT